MARLKRGLARLGKAVLKLVAAYVAIYLIVTLYGFVRVEIELARLRHAGEPLILAEMAPPPIPDSENAAIPYAKAFRVLDGKQLHSGDYAADQFLSTWARTHYPQTAGPAREFVRKYHKALDYAQEAASKPKCRFPMDWSKDPFSILVPQNPGLGRVCYVSSVATILAAMDGKPDEAVRLLLLQIRAADAVKDEPLLISQLVRQREMKASAVTLRKVAAYGGIDARRAARLYGAFSSVDLKSTFTQSIRAERAAGLRIFSETHRHPFRTYGYIHDSFG